jgi:hypothetical protein
VEHRGRVVYRVALIFQSQVCTPNTAHLPRLWDGATLLCHAELQTKFAGATELAEAKSTSFVTSWRLGVMVFLHLSAKQRACGSNVWQQRPRSPSFPGGFTAWHSLLLL